VVTEAREQQIRLKIRECHERKLQFVKAGDRRAAIRVLREAKVQENKLAQVENMRLMCNTAIDSLSDGEILQQTVGALSSVSHQLKGKINTQTMFRELEHSSDGMIQFRDDMSEMDAMLAQTLQPTAQIDDEDLERELDLLISEESPAAPVARPASSLPVSEWPDPPRKPLRPEAGPGLRALYNFDQGGVRPAEPC